ncbi:MAG TPA: FKBP-type peptidyl-prolyl cis-trans isomerase [Candidatus Polarisedimenticolaceae bacterium]|nr:FKBP-type peptidyl-prolyl cis-trans isomerase [Candidatus Polarisedimenticolaceae bacterium]
MMRIPACLLIAALALSCSSRAAEVEPKTEDDKTLYAMGLVLGGNITPFKLTEAELEFVKAGIADAALNRDKKVDLEAYRPKIQALVTARKTAAATAEKQKGADYLAKVATEAGVQKTASGVLYKITQEGTGPMPTAADTVKVQYRGTFIDGVEFDSSAKHGGQPATFNLTPGPNGVIKCFGEGLQAVKVGGKAKLYCPADSAYGDAGRPGIPGGAALLFDVELVEIVKATAPPTTPEGKSTP